MNQVNILLYVSLLDWGAVLYWSVEPVNINRVLLWPHNKRARRSGDQQIGPLFRQNFMTYVTYPIVTKHSVCGLCDVIDRSTDLVPTVAKCVVDRLYYCTIFVCRIANLPGRETCTCNELNVRQMHGRIVRGSYLIIKLWRLTNKSFCSLTYG